MMIEQVKQDIQNLLNVLPSLKIDSIKELIEKIYKFLDELKTKNYESVLIVAHSGVSKAFSCYFEGIQDGFLLNRGLKNCDLKEYDL
jgi:broad specificity phosphatase PhoE